MATTFYNKTKDIIKTQQFLGHAKVETTQLYTKLRKEDLTKTE